MTEAEKILRRLVAWSDNGAAAGDERAFIIADARAYLAREQNPVARGVVYLTSVAAYGEWHMFAIDADGGMWACQAGVWDWHTVPAPPASPAPSSSPREER